MNSERYQEARELGIDMESDRIRANSRADMNAFQRPASLAQDKRLLLTDEMTVDDAEGEQRWIAMAIPDLAEVRR